MNKLPSALIALLCLFGVFVTAQDSVITIGVESADPFIKVKDGTTPKGLSVDF